MPRSYAKMCMKSATQKLSNGKSYKKKLFTTLSLQMLLHVSA